MDGKKKWEGKVFVVHSPFPPFSYFSHFGKERKGRMMGREDAFKSDILSFFGGRHKHIKYFSFLVYIYIFFSFYHLASFFLSYRFHSHIQVGNSSLSCSYCFFYGFLVHFLHLFAIFFILRISRLSCNYHVYFPLCFWHSHSFFLRTVPFLHLSLPPTHSPAASPTPPSPATR